MTTRERIDRLIERAGKQATLDYEKDGVTNRYWIGYINALNELKLMVKPSEGGIDDEPI